MFNIEFLHLIRDHEYELILGHLSLGARVLEIGGGTGYQAKRLAEDGFKITSIDLPESAYADKQVFPVHPYDGQNIPFPDNSFDVVFSSNVLEHVKCLEQLHKESVRVLQPGGYCLHIMPTGSWRLWTNFTHFIDLFLRLVSKITYSTAPPSTNNSACHDTTSATTNFSITSLLKHLIVPRHGEAGNAIKEIYTFSSMCWQNHFLKAGFCVEKTLPMGLFYTGHMILGRRLSMRYRHFLSYILGSACMLYKVRPVDVAASRVPIKLIQEERR